MSLKVILSLTTIFSFTSLLPATVVATESSAEPRPLSERMAEDHLIPIDPGQLDPLFLTDLWAESSAEPHPLDELAERLKQRTKNKAFFRENAHIVIPDLSELMAEDHLWEPIPITFFRENTHIVTPDLSERMAEDHLREPIPIDPEQLDILFLIDNGSDMQRIKEQPMGPEEKARWEDFKQTVANMSFDKVSIRMRFSLNEDGQLMCWGTHGSLPLDCEEMINQMFSWIEKAEEKDSLTVSNTEQLIQDFILGQLRQTEAARKLSARLEQFMKDHEFSDWAIILTSHNRTAETQDQPSE